MVTQKNIDQRVWDLSEKFKSFFIENFCHNERFYFRQKDGWDLFGTIDSLYTGYILNDSDSFAIPDFETLVARILKCQDSKGWFVKNNPTRNSKEHATAYAISALKMLSGDNSDYLSKIQPLSGIRELVTDLDKSEKWIRRMGFQFRFDDPAKYLGWHYIWRASHIGGGVAAALGVTRHLFEKWWGEGELVDRWFNWYFDWLDEEINLDTGFWQRGFWNWFYKKTNIIDLGGAAHFYWIYEQAGRPFPAPAALIESVLAVQGEDGLYRDYPMCIDFDANFCLTRAFKQLSKESKDIYRDRVHDSLKQNFEAIVNRLIEKSLEEIYETSHGPPGALAALVECKKFPEFEYAGAIEDWQNPFDHVWWL